VAQTSSYLSIIIFLNECCYISNACLEIRSTFSPKNPILILPRRFSTRKRVMIMILKVYYSNQ
jgi:hypothetical protein